MARYYDDSTGRYLDCTVLPLPPSTYTGGSSLAGVVALGAKSESYAPRGPHRNRPHVATKVSTYAVRSDHGSGWRKMDASHPNAQPCATCASGFLRPCDVRRRFISCQVCRRAKRRTV